MSSAWCQERCKCLVHVGCYYYYYYFPPFLSEHLLASPAHIFPKNTISWISGLKKKKPWFAAFTSSCGVSTPTVANLKFLMWWHWPWSWEEVCTAGWYVPVRAGSGAPPLSLPSLWEPEYFVLASAGAGKSKGLWAESDVIATVCCKGQLVFAVLLSVCTHS